MTATSTNNSTKKNSNAKSEEPASNEAAATAPTSNDSDWEELPTDRRIYKPETCGGTPLVGYLLDCVEMPPHEKFGAWSAFIIKLTQPCKVEDIEGNVIDAAVGSEVLIVRTTKLRELERYVVPDFLLEVKVQPLKKVAVPAGSMWTYAVVGNKKTMKTRGRLHVIASRSAIAQLPAASSDLPF